MPEINDGPLLWYRARVTFKGERPIDILPTLTNDPVGLRRGFGLNYSEAEKIQMWECSADGTPMEPAAEADQEGENQGALPQPKNAQDAEEAKRPPGMGQLFR